MIPCCFSTDDVSERRWPSDLPSQFESLFNFLEGVGSVYHNFMRNGSGKLLVYHLLCLTGREGLGTRLDTRCLPAFSIQLISCRSWCRRELNKPTDVVGCYSVQYCREWCTCEENRRYTASWCVPPYVAAQSFLIHASIIISFCMAHRVPNK